MSNLLNAGKAVIMIFLFLSFLYANAEVRDSLYNELQKSIEDTNKVKLLNNLAWNYMYSNPDSAEHYANQGLTLAEKLNYNLGIADCKVAIGAKNILVHNYPSAIQNFEKALVLYKQLNDFKGIANCYNNTGLTYQKQDQFDKAIEYYQKALEVNEKHELINNLAGNLNNIAIIHHIQSNYERALAYYKEASIIYEDLENFRNLSKIYNNMGAIYDDFNLLDSSIYFHQSALEIRREIGDVYGIISSTSNLGIINRELGKYDIALDNFNESLELSKQVKESKQVSRIYTNIASVYNKMAELNQANKNSLYYKAVNYAKKSLTISTENNYLSMQQIAYDQLVESYKGLNKYKEAFDYQQLKIIANDSLFNLEKNKQIEELETKYQTEKKEQEIILQKEQLNRKEIELKQERLQKYSFFIGLLLFAFLGLVIFRNYLQKKKANILLAQQRDLILEQKEEITDSIKYAKRIQSAILPKESYIQNLLKDYFVFYKPRDIVSGDYYWMAEKDNKAIIVAADCTGHGVPGAFVSMLGVSFLNEIVNKKEVIDAATILNELRKSVKETLGQTGKDGEAKDGMDIALCIIDFQSNVLQYAGAYNPLYIIRNAELIEIKADKMPIGIYIVEKESFTNHKVELEKDDCIYLFSDGFVDQFGGEKGGKFKTKPFKNLLIENATKPMNEQYSLLDETFNNWKKEYEQVDDVTIIGIRI